MVAGNGSALEGAEPLPVFGADKDEAQLLDDFLLRTQWLSTAVSRFIDQLWQGREHGFHHQVSNYRQRGIVQVLPTRHARKVSGQV
ncbi:hypothetical protein D3C84_1096770 [compost metagenome]